MHKNAKSPPPPKPTSSGPWRLTAGAQSVARRGFNRAESRAPIRGARSAPRPAPGVARPRRVGRDQDQRRLAAPGRAGQSQPQAGRRGLSRGRAMGRGWTRPGAKRLEAPRAVVGEVTRVGPGWRLFPRLPPQCAAAAWTPLGLALFLPVSASVCLCLRAGLRFCIPQAQLLALLGPTAAGSPPLAAHRTPAPRSELLRAHRWGCPYSSTP